MPDSLTPSHEDPPFREDAPSREERPSREEVIVTEALRRRALAIANRCLPAIIREARYEQLDELLDIFFWFGSPEAMLLENPEGHFGTPGLTLQEGNALVRFRIKRGESYAPFGDAEPETPPPAPRLVMPPSPPTPAKAPPRATSGLYRVFRNGRMWFVDPKTKKIVSEAPP